MSTKDGLRDLRIYYFHADRAHRNEPNPSPKESLVRLAAERAAKRDAGGRRSGSDDQQLRKRRHRAHQDNEGKGSQR